jgi:hypothetical protein
MATSSVPGSPRLRDGISFANHMSYKDEDRRMLAEVVTETWPRHHPDPGMLQPINLTR